MQPIEERRRDPFITEEAYAECQENTETMFTSEKFVEDRAQIDPKYGPDGARQISFWRVYRLIQGAWMSYSAGDPLVGLRERVKYILEDLQRHKEAFPEKSFKLWEPDAYYYTMLLTSWAVLFDLPECLDILAGYVSRDPKDGEDRFVSTLFHTLGIPDFPGKQAGLLHEDPYGILYDSLTGSKEDQQNAMKAYLKRWYKSKAIRGCFWRERHSLSPSAHLGYWAFETGMLTIINDLDDSGYRDMPYYPRDMVDYCREQGWHKKIAERVQAIRDTRNGDPQTLGGNMQPFETRRRDPFITEEAYATWLKNTESMFTDTTYVESRDQIKQVTNDPAAARRVSFYRAESFIEDVWARYSAGESLGGLRERVKYAFDELQRHKEAFPEVSFKLWEPDAYCYTMLLTSWSVLFDLPECLDILAGYVSRDPKDGEDRFVSTLFHTLGIPDFPGKQAGLLHEDPYGILYDSLTGSKEDQQKAMKAYLKRWYKSKAIRGCYWRERHSFKPSMHLGYWAFETGMLTIINDLDDSGYRDMPYYPRDMVDYCREQGWHKKIAERVQAIRDTRNGDPQTREGDMQPFETRRRDPFITEKAYQEYLAATERMFTDTRFAEDREQVKKDKAHDPAAALRVSFYRAELFIEAAWARYSAGEPLGELRERVKYAFEDLQRHKVAFPEEDFRLWEPTDYHYTMLLTSWSVLFDLPECLGILAGYVNRDPKYGGDRFVSTLFHTLGIPDFPGQAGLLHEDPYGILYDSLTESKEDQQKAMKKYLKRWYKSKAIRGCYWRERHSFKPSMHLGYWAFETGMLTIINDLDDSGYRDMPYYPRDMVDYCREQGWHKKIAERVQAIREER